MAEADTLILVRPQKECFFSPKALAKISMALTRLCANLGTNSCDRRARVYKLTQNNQGLPLSIHFNRTMAESRGRGEFPKGKLK